MAWPAVKFDNSEKIEKQEFFRRLDRGIDDMESGRELSVQDAFQKISELRVSRRNARI